jgi:hypothetical protein
LPEAEHTFSISYPESYKAFCREYETKDAVSVYRHLGNGRFISDLETLIRINARIGEEQWGDYELAILGERHSKSGLSFWGGLLPFFFYTINTDVLGFSLEETDSDVVYVWNVHCIVHSFPSFENWLTRGGRSGR